MSTYPFFYLYNLTFNASPIIDFINSIPEDEWSGPKFKNKEDERRLKIHPAQGLIWHANDKQSNFKSCKEILEIKNYFLESTGFNLINGGMMIKKSKKGYRAPFHPLMQYVDYDKKHYIKRTFDVIIPLQGGFKESPLEAIDTKTNEHFVLKPKGIPFIVPSDPSWHYSWEETVEDYRLTLHLRGVQPSTYKHIKSVFTI